MKQQERIKRMQRIGADARHGKGLVQSGQVDKAEKIVEEVIAPRYANLWKEKQYHER